MGLNWICFCCYCVFLLYFTPVKSVVCGLDGFQNSLSHSRGLERGGVQTLINKLGLSDMFQTLLSYLQILAGVYSIYPWVGRCSPAPHTLTLFWYSVEDIRRTYAQAVYHPRKDTLSKTKIDKLNTPIKTKMMKSIPSLRQKSRKTYPGWPHVPIKPL